MLHVLAIVFALIAIALMFVAIAGMATKTHSARTGTVLRACALLSFLVAVILNVVRQ
jgi:hypothetical protein